METTSGVAPGDTLPHELRLVTSPDKTSVKAFLDGLPVFDGALDPADISGQVKVKIGNPLEDQDAGPGPARASDVGHDDLRVENRV